MWDGVGRDGNEASMNVPYIVRNYVRNINVAYL